MVKKSLKPDILKLVKQYGVLIKGKLPVQKFIVFGSQAKGTTHEWSDIDI